MSMALNARSQSRLDTTSSLRTRSTASMSAPMDCDSRTTFVAASFMFADRRVSSCATTPKPAPAVPARAASMRAFMDSRWMPRLMSCMRSTAPITCARMPCDNATTRAINSSVDSIGPSLARSSLADTQTSSLLSCSLRSWIRGIRALRRNMGLLQHSTLQMQRCAWGNQLLKSAVKPAEIRYGEAAGHAGERGMSFHATRKLRFQQGFHRHDLRRTTGTDHHVYFARLDSRTFQHRHHAFLRTCQHRREDEIELLAAEGDIEIQFGNVDGRMQLAGQRHLGGADGLEAVVAVVEGDQVQQPLQFFRTGSAARDAIHHHGARVVLVQQECRLPVDQAGLEFLEGEQRVDETAIHLAHPALALAQF